MNRTTELWKIVENGPLSDDSEVQSCLSQASCLILECFPTLSLRTTNLLIDILDLFRRVIITVAIS